MSRVLFKIIIPAALMAIWVNMCYWICKTDIGIDTFKMWIMCGFPYGITKTIIFLPPSSYGISGGVGMLALDAILAGLIGGVVLIVRVFQILFEVLITILEIAGHFWSRCPEVVEIDDFDV